MSYGVPGGSAARHIVFDAPEAKDGTSAVSAASRSGRCVVSIAAGAGGGAAGRPLIFDVASAKDGCTIKVGVDAPGGAPLAARGAVTAEADDEPSEPAPRHGLRWWYHRLRNAMLVFGALFALPVIALVIVGRRRRSRAKPT